MHWYSSILRKNELGQKSEATRKKACQAAWTQDYAE